ncbi:MAG: hypothetical protein P1T08_09160 [Acidimicrobiia bacterium]|nr:hypothetical protein [Acidimicrobiia bacterium]
MTQSGRSPATASDSTPNWVPLVGVGIVSLLILGVMRPDLIFAANTPAGGDMGAHVLGPAFLRDVLLPSGQIMGWSNSWFAGFPIFYFYFPLPSLVIVFLDLVLPYGIAFKMVTVAGLLATPPAAYFLARSMGLSRAVATVGGAAGGSFVFIESFTIYGANIASTLAGEFSFSWSFALSLLYFGLLIRGLKDDPSLLPVAALVLGLTALSHVITTIVIVFATLPMLMWRRAAGRIAFTWIAGFAVAGFWALPLLARFGLTADMAWSPLTRWDELFPVEIWPIVPLAVVGMVWAVRKTARAVPVVGLTLIPLIYFWLPVAFAEQPWKLWNGRLLPYWFFGLSFFAGLAVGALMVGLARRLPKQLALWQPITAVVTIALLMAAGAFSGRPGNSGIALIVAGVVALAALAAMVFALEVRTAIVLVLAGSVGFAGAGGLGIAFLSGWATWNYSGYESKAPWPEYEALMETIDTLPDGRIQWEVDSDYLDQYGTSMSLMLFPYWSDGHPSMEGLFFESSLTTPFHFLNAAEMSRKPSNPIPGLNYHTFDFERGVEHLEIYGVRYYVAFSEEALAEAAALPEVFEEVAASGPFRVYELPSHDLVEVATHEPAVYADGRGGSLFAKVLGVPLSIITGEERKSPFGDLAFEWYDDIDLLDRWVTANGPANWPRIDGLDELPLVPIGEHAPATNVQITDDSLSFDTTAIGVPHLVKISYFPNWTAEGADGPYRATPSLMVVVPTEGHVELRFERTWAEWIGIVLTVVGLAITLPFVWRRATAK